MLGLRASTHTESRGTCPFLVTSTLEFSQRGGQVWRQLAEKGLDGPRVHITKTFHGVHSLPSLGTISFVSHVEEFSRLSTCGRDVG